MDVTIDGNSVPCLDFTGFEVSLSDEDIQPALWKGRLKDQLVRALTEVGFLQVTGHGIPRESIEQCFESGQRFFNKSIDYKMQFYRDFTKARCGYVPMSGSTKQAVVTETFDLQKPPDIKECLDVCHSCDNWTDTEFQRHTLDLIHFSQSLVSRLLILLGHGLAPENPSLFKDCFNNFATEHNTSQLRFLRYPPLSDTESKSRLRCGEHTDYGCLTLVFMDTCPGLQVFTRSQNYVDVVPVPGAVLINIGDLMQRWTGDLLRSAKHRVIFRGSETYKRERYSLVYFSHPDEEQTVTPMLGPNRNYPAVLVRDHMDRRFEDTFKRGKGLDETLTASS